MNCTGPLKGIKVLDFTHVLSASHGTMLLGDLGAEIIKVEKLFEDPQFNALDLIAKLGHATAGDVDILKPPFHLSETPESVTLPPPALGEHTTSLLIEHGFTDEEINDMMKEGVIEGT